MPNIYTDDVGHKVVEIDTVIFSGKRKIDWNGVENYLKKYIGYEYVIDETGDVVYISSDFPDEYANSKYSTKALGTIGKAKANASQVIPELIKIATNISFQGNTEPKHAKNAKYGWYRCTVRFNLPISDDKGNVIGKNYFQGRMIIRHAYDGKKYLYDMIDIKKET
ncbi:MAG: hypothetical protein NC419_02655 [Muribaculaceae bacterium]|nr:hypothetical protein [Muribaculaceae bacterium]